MSEYWKSTPKYWCKHCSTYVRDTKLDRANHEATGKHRGGVERALRDLHRGHEKEQREKDRARREVERLNGVVAGGAPSSSSRPSAGGPPRPPPQAAALQAAAAAAPVSKDQRQAQLEQLALLGVNIPDELRKDMALAGEWTVTKTRVVEDGAAGAGAEGRATGVRKRELDKEGEEQKKEEEDAVRGLFKKQRRWGRDTRAHPGREGQDDEELERLLSGVVAKKEEVKTEVRDEAVDGALPKVKTEEEGAGDDSGGMEESRNETPVKKEDADGEGEGGDGAAAAAAAADAAAGDKTAPHRTEAAPGGQGAADAGAAAVVFKKRKAKNIRQK